MRAGRRHRKWSTGSNHTNEKPTRKSSYASGGSSPVNEKNGQPSGASVASANNSVIGDEADDESHPHRSRGASFGEHFTEKLSRKQKKREKKERKHRKRQARHIEEEVELENIPAPILEEKSTANAYNEPRRVDFAVSSTEENQVTQKKPFTIGGLNLRPTIPKTFSQTVFTQAPGTNGTQAAPTGPIPRVRYGIRRTNSLPDRLNQQRNPVPGVTRAPSQLLAAPILADISATDPKKEEENISRTTAVLLLLISTGLVALCAEFMVDSIQDVVDNTSLGETFVGLIILPIVGNAAEHVTAVSVASKNKMDLAIGVAVGSSIQIALFVTPFVVLLGWAMGKEMSLYFTLFETVCLFVSAFIVNFLGMSFIVNVDLFKLT